MDDERTCRDCGFTGPSHGFARENWCRDCYRAYHREYKRRRMAEDPVYAEKVRQADRDAKRALREDPEYREDERARQYEASHTEEGRRRQHKKAQGRYLRGKLPGWMYS